MFDDERRKLYSKNYKEGTTQITNQEGPKLKTVLDWMGKEIGNEKKFIVDLGCSEGVFLDIFAKKFTNARFVGVDISEPCVKGVRKRGFQCYLCDIENDKLPFKSGSVDGIYSGDLIEHIFKMDRFLAEIKRVLKPGGWVIFTTPNIHSFSHRIMTLFGVENFYSDREDVEHVRFFTRSSLRRLLESKDLKIDRLTTKNIVIPYFARLKIIEPGGPIGEKIIVMARKS